MKQLYTGLLLVVISAFFFASCSTSKRVDKQVAKYYNGVMDINKKKLPANVSISSSIENNMGDKLSQTVTKTSNFLPLLVYWKWDYANNGVLNPQIPMNNFMTAFNRYAKNGLQSKLDGQTLELSVDQIPHKFQLMDKGHVIYALVYAFTWDVVTIGSEDTDMVVSYKLKKDGVETKNGTITVPNIYDKRGLGMFKTLKKAMSEYLYQYDSNITQMAKTLVSRLRDEI